MTRKSLKPRGLARLTVLCLPVAAAVVLPSAAIAATGASTVRATIGGDGAVQSVKTYAAGGTATAFNGTLPVKLTISRTVSGSTSTYHYRVENTFSKQQSVTYTDTAGKTHTTTAELQLPLVAQLGVELPSSFTDVSTPNGVVQTDPEGVNRVLFSLVLFSPLGAPTQDVTLTATGSGAPTAELTATAVNPASTAGLSQSSQDANASGQQDDFWASFATGGNGGLTQLATGVAQMVSGLTSLAPGAHQLADGIKAAGAGAIKLDDGTKSAYDGSKKLAAGTKSAHTGSSQLATGVSQIHDGNVSLAGGLAEIKGGLALLDGKTPSSAGVQGAVDGIAAIEAGVKLLEAGLAGPGGSALSPKAPSVLDGIMGVSATPLDPATPPGLIQSIGLVKTGLTPLASGLDCTEIVLTDILKGTGPGGTATAGTTNPCYVSTADPTGVVPLMAAASDPTAAFILTGMTAPAAANPNGIPAAASGVHGLVDAGGTFDKIHFGLTHAAGTLSASDPGGLQQVLQQIALGLDSHAPGTFGSTDKGGVDYGLLALLDPKVGLPAAVAGIDQLFTGSVAASTGADQLAAGSGTAATGAKALDSGLGEIATGTAALSSGLGELSTGQHQVATGLPAAVSGSAQIATGADQLKAGAIAVHNGILAVQSGAVGPLLTQITQGSQNAKKQLAILDAAGALAAQAPGGAGTAYVLSQSPLGFRLAAATTKSGGSDTGRNVGIGLGGLVALVIAVTAGFAIGRRSSVSA